MKRAVGVTLVILGLMIIFYPLAREIYFKYQQEKIMRAITDSWGPDDVEQESEHEPAEPRESQPTGGNYWSQYVREHTEGILQIKKINLRLPILKGATETNLNFSAASIEGSGKPGDVGNYCISAHHSRFYGYQFNRLDELKAGDEVEIIVGDGVHRYQVFDKMVVKAEDTWVLLPQENESLVTLITCDYREKMYPRLIVKARLKP